MNIQQQFQKDILLAPFTTFGIGGPADYFFVARSTDALANAIQWARENTIDFFILGKGANILIGDKGFRGLVIKNEANKIEMQSGKAVEPQNKNVLLTAESGVFIEDLITMTAKKGLSGLEHYAGIPSTLGGAMWQNLHFYSPDRTRTVFIAEIVKGATIFTTDNKKKTVTRKYFQYGYDFSILHKVKDIVLDVTLELMSEDKKVIQERIQANVKWRKEKHPEWAEERSAGSIFKNIPNHGAGRLVDKVGLKGKRIGGAEIAPTHANFIVNAGNATAKDVRALISLAQETVEKELGLQLEPEIRFVGEF